MAIKYPTTEEEQRKIARGFQRKSTRAHFDCCAGAIDGILIWTHKPTLKECEKTKQTQIKYLCGRKKKYGLNMQAVCDSQGRFLDVSIQYGGASSDLIAFESSELHRKLVDGLLAEGLCLFGDNAYMNSMFMATPYSGKNQVHPKDRYNFCHSQLQINIECAFGRLVMRWGFLQMKAPKQFSVAKIIATVVCLCRLHNYCTNCSLARDEDPEPAQPLKEDADTIAKNKGVELVSETRKDLNIKYVSVNALLDGGDHFNDAVRFEGKLVERG